MPKSSRTHGPGKHAPVIPLSSGHPVTPPTAQLPTPLEFARQVIDTVKLIQSSKSEEASPGATLQVDCSVQQPEPIIQASKLEAREVHEV